MPPFRSFHPLWLAIPLLLAPSAGWIALDHHVWPWDQAWYAQVSVQLWHALTHSFRDWAVTMGTAMYAKPPAIVWLGQLFVPLRHITGSVESALLLSILGVQGVLLAIIYRIGRILSPLSSLPALAGVVFTAAAQAFVGLSEQFLVEPFQAVAVAWTVWIALESRKWPFARIVVHLSGALLLGALAKATTPVYCFVFCLFALSAVRKPLRFDFAREWKAPSSRCLILSIAALLPPSALWYAINLKNVWEHVRLSSSGEVALQYGFRAPVLQKVAVWLGLLRDSFLSPFLVWVFLAAFAIAAGFLWRRKPPAKAATLVIVLCAIQGATVLFLFSLNDVVDPRYMFALVVNVAAIFMALCSLIGSRAVVVILLAVCAAQWAAVNRCALGSKDLLGGSAWLPAPHADRSEYAELTRVIERTSTAPGRYNIIGVEEPWLNSNSAAFFAAKNELATGVFSYYTSLGYAANDTSAALRRMADLRTHYFVTLAEPAQSTPPNFLNVVSAPVLRQIRQNPHFAAVPFASQKGILIFESRP